MLEDESSVVAAIDAAVVAGGACLTVVVWPRSAHTAVFSDGANPGRSDHHLEQPRYLKWYSAFASLIVVVCASVQTPATST